MSQRDSVKFLIVDDREENLIALEALLRRDGLEILQAKGGEAALELLLEHDVALALIDVNMPDMDGFALAELMRGAQRTRHVPIIFVTASTQEQTREFRGYDAGAVDFLFKPLDPRILRHKTDTFFELHRQRKELEQTLRLAETFMAAVGHDLKTPLNAIALGTELILSSPDSSANKRTAERIRSSSKRMQRMIDDLFDLARARLGSGIPIERTSADLAATTRRVVGEVETANPTLTITLVVAPDLDAAGAWDGDRVAQVVSNLLANAVRHGKKGAPIGVSLAADGEDVILTVHNEGVVAPDVLPHIFAPFRSRNDYRARAEGLGLGLFIVERIVSAHGGRIDVVSDEARGTTFRVCLPRHAYAPGEARDTKGETWPKLSVP